MLKVRQYEVELSLFLTILALLLWSYSLPQIKVSAIDDLGIFHALPVSFFCALSLLTLASGIFWISYVSHGKLLFLQVCLFIVFLWATPLIVGCTTVGTRYIYAIHTLTEYIYRYGHLDPSTQWYHNWPGINLFEFTLFRILGIQKIDLFFNIASFLIQYMFLVPLYLIFHNTIRGNGKWTAIWLFCLFNWTGQTYYSPQAMGFLFLLLLMSLLLNIKRQQVIDEIQIIIVMIGLTITHLLTSITGVFVTLAIWQQNKRLRCPLLIILFILVVSWLIYQATPYFNKGVPSFFEHAFRLDFIWTNNVQRAIKGTEGHQIIAIIRIVFTSLFGMICALGLYLSRYYKNIYDKTFLTIGVGIILMIPLALYQGEFLMRISLFSLPIFAYFGAKLLHNKATSVILVILMLVAIPLNNFSLNGNQAIDNISVCQRSYWDFIKTKTEEGNLAGGGVVMTWTMGYPRKYSWDESIFYNTNWHDILINDKWVQENTPNYLTLSAYEDKIYNIMVNDPQYVPQMRNWLKNSRSYDLIYKNPETDTFLLCNK